MKNGTHVVYLKNKDISLLGLNKKDIWIVTGYVLSLDFLDIKSISKNKSFQAHPSDLISINELKRIGKFKEEYFIEKAYNKITESKKMSYEGKKMSYKETNIVKRTTDANVSAGKVAATIATGKTINALVASKVVPQLPLMVKVYADTAIGTLVIANIVDFVVKQYMADNRKANFASDAMMQAAMVELLAEFDFEVMIEDILSNVTLPEEVTAE